MTYLNEFWILASQIADFPKFSCHPFLNTISEQCQKSARKIQYTFTDTLVDSVKKLISKSYVGYDGYLSYVHIGLLFLPALF